ncbi:MAG: hypothetical protein MI923_05415 [Phycisphaerales bacterium]|nr:hypothetical protein [Phycisphaerales bacterium]
MTHQERDSEMSDTPAPKPAVELEPLVTRAEAPRHVVRSEMVVGHDGDYGQPIPEHPLHMCPECDYRLTGLTSRRCPECGTPFTLITSRRHAGKFLPRGKQDYQVVRNQKIAYYAGLCLLIVGTIAPMFSFQRAVMLSIFWMISLGMTVLLFVSMWKVYYQKTWSDAMLIGGIAAATIGTILLLF